MRVPAVEAALPVRRWPLAAFGVAAARVLGSDRSPDGSGDFEGCADDRPPGVETGILDGVRGRDSGSSPGSIRRPPMKRPPEPATLRPRSRAQILPSLREPSTPQAPGTYLRLNFQARERYLPHPRNASGMSNPANTRLMYWARLLHHRTGLHPYRPVSRLWSDAMPPNIRNQRN